MIETATIDTQCAREKDFVNRLGSLSPGDKARLKRHAGLTLAESIDVLGAFFRVLPYEVPERQHEQYFLVATLFPLADESNQRGNFGMSMRRMRTDSNKAGLDRRMEVLLDADAQQLPFRLRQLVRRAHAGRVGVNWAELLHDIIAWDRPGRWVQKNWAMSYFANQRRDAEQDNPDEQRSGDDVGDTPA